MRGEKKAKKEKAFSYRRVCKEIYVPYIIKMNIKARTYSVIKWYGMFINGVFRASNHDLGLTLTLINGD